MGGRAQETAGQGDLNNHLRDDWKRAHRIWENIRTLIPTFVPLTPTALTLTNDGAWHDLSLASLVPSTAFLIQMRVVGINGGRWMYFYFGAAGTTTGSGVASFTWEMDTPITKKEMSAQVDLRITGQAMAYKMSSEAADEVYLTGYWKTGL